MDPIPVFHMIMAADHVHTASGFFFVAIPPVPVLVAPIRLMSPPLLMALSLT
jgi:hypothetical protein